jgi:hypothetical protein
MQRYKFLCIINLLVISHKEELKNTSVAYPQEKYAKCGVYFY